MILLGERLVASVLDGLELLLVGYLRVKELVLVDIVLVLQLLLQIRRVLLPEALHFLLVLLAELRDPRLVALFCALAVFLAVFADRAEVILLVVLL